MSTSIKYNGTEITTISDEGGTKILATKGKIMNSNLEVSATAGSSSIYKFYTQSGEEIKDITVAGLANAYYYTKNGGAQQRVGGRIYHINSDIAEGEGYKFYVVGTDSSDTTYGGLKYTTKYWGYYGITTGTTGQTGCDALGKGKSNTDTILAISDTSSYSDSIFAWIKTLRDSSYNGCNDWFIGSRVEQDPLRNSGLTTIYSAEYVWSSVEGSSDSAYYWLYRYSYWGDANKYRSYVGLALRAF